MIKGRKQPQYGTGQALTAGTTGLSTSVPKGTKQLIITNPSANVIYIRVTGDSVLASIADYPVLPGRQEVISKDGDETRVSYYSATAGSNFHLMAGEGF
jgi:hypothetical protein